MFVEFVDEGKNQNKNVSQLHSQVKVCELPIVLYQECGEYIAECPLFYVSSHGHSEEEALDRVKEALQLYLDDPNVQNEIPIEVDCSKEAMFKKSAELFNEYSEPGEQHPEYSYRKIIVCVH
ncbi:type II toxin-antitoxin system HicB family antitoxin [Methanobacterium spitsbergense]|uniref:Type II toxin-antitoxin system HicB family antitoxin n=1 Tax=Methanobacterium spitsbergense TaxID=2874285 RepID=A0A8T5URI3_9EURY|nr:type II toxin-antitoxin system HicB family antitoxin [Methanobacterium spitsbergense]MBZ2166378.1 type II toxin-antitoxin system HicB family antitoxin [Methanobacterium spitsbergense]